MKVRPAGKSKRRRRPSSGSWNAGVVDVRRVVDFRQRLERRRERAVLEEVALPGQRVVEQAPAGAHAGRAVARGVPR